MSYSLPAGMSREMPLLYLSRRPPPANGLRYVGTRLLSVEHGREGRHALPKGTCPKISLFTALWVLHIAASCKLAEKNLRWLEISFNVRSIRSRLLARCQ